MTFRASFCGPTSPEITEIGRIDEQEIIKKFSDVNWSGYLSDMRNLPEAKVHYSPSLEIENQENKNGLTISAIGGPQNFHFLVFYKRPKKIKFLGLFERMNQNYSSYKDNCNREEAIAYLEALKRNDLGLLEAEII